MKYYSTDLNNFPLLISFLAKTLAAVLFPSNRYLICFNYKDPNMQKRIPALKSYLIELVSDIQFHYLVGRCFHKFVKISS